jgi:uncharacterized membrane protein
MLVSGTGALAGGSLWLFPAGTLIGFAGMLLDSIVGGTVQGSFWCTSCGQPSEWPVHRCGNRTEWKAGWSWLNNDGVNLLATGMAGAMAWALWWWLD